MCEARFQLVLLFKGETLFTEALIAAPPIEQSMIFPPGGETAYSSKSGEGRKRPLKGREERASWEKAENCEENTLLSTPTDI